ncbi:YhcN/YlaJ family sporulation lipoprotein [Paenibacillus alginolyticus]|uniref:YhcN/YlaJ family sporulation lipoprotein n=1 Tax=Paenibacillus alginolyticus TaxID=59839 RepID=UPI0022845539|nr:YhcN/YlaJ family sporulation lipoprotein [Paenibacillus alginolyticus]
MIGCTTNNNQTQQPGVQMQQAQDQPQKNLDTLVQIANQAAEKITQLNGVRQANVLVTQRNAYVAVVVNDTEGQLTSKIVIKYNSTGIIFGISRENCHALAFKCSAFFFVNT